MTQEFEIMQYLYSRKDKLLGTYPQPYFKHIYPEPTEITEIICPALQAEVDKFLEAEDVETIGPISQVTVYEYLEGETVDVDNIDEQLENEIMGQIESLHANNIVHGDVAFRNIILLTNGKYTLIDFGSSFSVDGILFPPNDDTHIITFDDEEWTVRDDFIGLQQGVIRALRLKMKKLQQEIIGALQSK